MTAQLSLYFTTQLTATSTIVIVEERFPMQMETLLGFNIQTSNMSVAEGVNCSDNLCKLGSLD